MPTISIGQFVEGMDTLHAEDDQVFNPVASQDGGLSAPRRCRAAINVDLDDSGRPQLRDGTTSRVSATSGLATFSALGLLLFQDQGTIKKVDPDTYATTDLVTGLNTSAKVVFHEHNGAIWWTNGIENGQITSAGTATNWGLDVPPSPTLAAIAGTLPAGRYMVVATLVDANGVEHCAGESSLITLAAAGAFTADLSSYDSNAVTARFYATRTNGSQLYYVGEAAVGSLPVTISDVTVSEEPIRTQFFSPPIPGAGMFSFHGMIITFNGKWLYPSFGPAVHHYKLDETAESRPSDVVAGAGLNGGFWVVCEQGAYHTAGGVPGAWATNQKDSRKYAAGSLVISGTLLPGLKVMDNIALFVSEDGLMAGLSDGSLIPLTDDKHRLDVEGKDASIVYAEKDNFNQILWSLT